MESHLNIFHLISQCNQLNHPSTIDMINHKISNNFLWFQTRYTVGKTWKKWANWGSFYTNSLRAKQKNQYSGGWS